MVSQGVLVLCIVPIIYEGLVSDNNGQYSLVKVRKSRHPLKH